MSSVYLDESHEVVFLARFGRHDFFATEIFKNIIGVGYALKLTFPTNEVGLAFDLVVGFDLVHLGVSHV